MDVRTGLLGLLGLGRLVRLVRLFKLVRLGALDRRIGFGTWQVWCSQYRTLAPDGKLDHTLGGHSQSLMILSGLVGHGSILPRSTEQLKLAS